MWQNSYLFRKNITLLASFLSFCSVLFYLFSSLFDLIFVKIKPSFTLFCFSLGFLKRNLRQIWRSFAHDCKHVETFFVDKRQILYLLVPFLLHIYAWSVKLYSAQIQE